MLPGIAAIRRAESLMPADGVPPPRAALADAVEHVWLAATHRFEWPPDVRDAADAILSLACRTGAIGDAAERFNDSEVRQAVDLIRRLAALAEMRSGGSSRLA